jgi:hypothetical protein
VIDIPSKDLSNAMTKLDPVKGHMFVRLTEKGETREPWIFEMGNDGKAKRVHQHGWYWSRIE